MTAAANTGPVRLCLAWTWKGSRHSGWAVLLIVSACHPPGAVTPVDAFDGMYRGTRVLESGGCDPKPITLGIRVSNGHYAARDGGMVFDVNRDGDISGFGLYGSSGEIRDGHMHVTLRGAPPRGCTYVFDLQRVPAT